MSKNKARVPPSLEELEQAIIDLSKSVRNIEKSNLKEDAIVLLLQNASGIGKPAIRSILQNLRNLDVIYLKKPSGDEV